MYESNSYEDPNSPIAKPRFGDSHPKLNINLIKGEGNENKVKNKIKSKKNKIS